MLRRPARGPVALPPPCARGHRRPRSELLPESPLVPPGVGGTGRCAACRLQVETWLVRAASADVAHRLPPAAASQARRLRFSLARGPCGLATRPLGNPFPTLTEASVFPEPSTHAACASCPGGQGAASAAATLGRSRRPPRRARGEGGWSALPPRWNRQLPATRHRVNPALSPPFPRNSSRLPGRSIRRRCAARRASSPQPARTEVRVAIRVRRGARGVRSGPSARCSGCPAANAFMTSVPLDRRPPEGDLRSRAALPSTPYTPARPGRSLRGWHQRRSTPGRFSTDESVV